MTSSWCWRRMACGNSWATNRFFVLRYCVCAQYLTHDLAHYLAHYLHYFAQHLAQYLACGNSRTNTCNRCFSVSRYRECAHYLTHHLALYTLFGVWEFLSFDEVFLRCSLTMHQFLVSPCVAQSAHFPPLFFLIFFFLFLHFPPVFMMLNLHISLGDQDCWWL